VEILLIDGRLAMKILIYAHGMEVESSVRQHLERRLLFALSRFAPKIDKVEAGLIDVNGERAGGIDKRCRLVAKVAGVGRLVIQDDDAELLPLIDRTANRLGHLVGRKLEFARMVGRASASGSV
jgi:putative sigma-54 modulation protein